MKFSAALATLFAAPALALQGGYLSQMGGGSALKTSSFMPVGNGVIAPASYLDNISPASNGYAAPAADSPVFSFSEMAADGTLAETSGDYLTNLKVSSSMAGSGPVGYLDVLRVQASQNAATNLPGYLDTLRVQASTVTGGTGPVSYLDNLMGAAAVTAKVEAATEVTLRDNEPILAAINVLTENMNSNHQQTIGILQDINTSVQTLVAQTAHVPAQAVPVYEPPAPVVQQETTELTTVLESSYLGQMNGASPRVSAGPSSSWAPTKRVVVQKSGGAAGFRSYVDSF